MQGPHKVLTPITSLCCSFLQDQILNNTTTWDTATQYQYVTRNEDLHSLVLTDNDYPPGKKTLISLCLKYQSSHYVSYLEQKLEGAEKTLLLYHQYSIRFTLHRCYWNIAKNQTKRSFHLQFFQQSQQSATNQPTKCVHFCWKCQRQLKLEKQAQLAKQRETKIQRTDKQQKSSLQFTPSFKQEKNKRYHWMYIQA